MRRTSARIVLAAACAGGLGLNAPVHGQQLFQWTGNGSNDKWGNSDNWFEGTPSNDGTAYLVFGAVGSLTSTVNKPWSVYAMEFRAPPLIIDGKPITFRGTGGILDISRQPHAITNDLVLAGEQTWHVHGLEGFGGSSLTLGGEISGNFGITKTGFGSLTFLGQGNSYTGLTVVRQGTLNLAKKSGYAINGDLVIDGGAVNSVEGFGAQINPTSHITILNGTIFSAPLSGPGTSQIGPEPFPVGSVNVTGTAEISSGDAWDAANITLGGSLRVRQEAGLIVGGTLSFTGNSNPTLLVESGIVFPPPVPPPQFPPEAFVRIAGDVSFSGTSGEASILSVEDRQRIGTLDLAGGVRTFNIVSSGASMRISTSVVKGGVSKAGQGLLRLEASNSYAGGTVRESSGGIVEAAHASALGTGTVSFSGGTLRLKGDAGQATFGNSVAALPTGAGGASVNIEVSKETPSSATGGKFFLNQLTLGPALNVQGSSLIILTFAGATTLTAANTTINNSTGVEIGFAMGQSGGAFGFTKQGGGTLFFTGGLGNTYTGITTINEGALDLSRAEGVIGVPGDLVINNNAAVRMFLGNNQIAAGSRLTLNGAQGTPKLILGDRNQTLASVAFVAGGAIETANGTLGLGGDVTFTGTAGSGSISGKLNLGTTGARTFTVANGSAAEDLVISASISGSAGLLKVGPGTLALSGTSNSMGSMVVNQGVVALKEAGATKTGAAPVVASGAAIDLGKGKLVVDYPAGASSPLAGVRAAVLAGRGGSGFGAAKWNGTGGVNSSALVTGDGVSVAIGYVENSALPGLGLPSYTAFGGQSVDASSILIRYTRGADCNLDGKVNSDDVTVIGALYGNAATSHWFLGDFDYDGICDSDDITVLGAMYDATAPALSSGELTAQFGAEFAGALIRGRMSGVPEPGGIAMLGLGATGLMRRRVRGGTRELGGGADAWWNRRRK